MFDSVQLCALVNESVAGLYVNTIKRPDCSWHSSELTFGIESRDKRSNADLA